MNRFGLIPHHNDELASPFNPCRFGFAGHIWTEHMTTSKENAFRSNRRTVLAGLAVTLLAPSIAKAADTKALDARRGRDEDCGSQGH